MRYFFCKNCQSKICELCLIWLRPKLIWHTYFNANKSTDLVMATHHIIPVDFQGKHWCIHYLIIGLDKQKFSA